MQEIDHPVIGKYKAPGAPMLAGLRMADLTQQYAGPLGTELLAYYGMEVVKIETGTIASKEREAAVHACMNRAKLGCTLNLRNGAGKELFKQLVAKSDVVVDNFGSGVLERLGFSFEVLQRINPAIVQVVMPGWGLTGPLKSWVAWGWQLLAYTGIMRLWGYPDSPMEIRCKIAHHGLPGIPVLSVADAARPAPWIGANNDQVFGEILGLSKERIEGLKLAEAIK
jgi:crotonobetainyl-CoA:carnitine CoA-transferase CaiB-like acyl-CoA transferase